MKPIGQALLDQPLIDRLARRRQEPDAQRDFGAVAPWPPDGEKGVVAGDGEDFLTRYDAEDLVDIALEMPRCPVDGGDVPLGFEFLRHGEIDQVHIAAVENH